MVYLVKTLAIFPSSIVNYAKVRLLLVSIFLQLSCLGPNFIIGFLFLAQQEFSPIECELAVHRKKRKLALHRKERDLAVHLVQFTEVRQTSLG